MNHVPTNIRPADFSRVVYAHTVADGNNFEKDVLDDKYWCHLSKVLKVGDLIEVTAHDNTYFAQLYVQAVYNASVKVVCLFKRDLEASGEELEGNADYKVQYRKMRQWCIVRVSDSQVIKDQIQTKEDAFTELNSHLKALAA